jgi:cytochrome P450
MLIRYPGLQQALRDNPAQILTFIEEVLRTESPVQSNFRVATEDTELAGVKIPKGSVLVLRYGSANRDEQKFEESEQFNVCRRNVQAHVAFGAGIHHCPGAMLARQEALVTFTELLRRFDKFELRAPDELLDYVPSFFLRGLKQLPVTLGRQAQ